MIICPSCKEEIEEESHYCDQCGQELVYCSSCGRVGMGRRCTYCGGLMVGPDEAKDQRNVPNQPGVAEKQNVSYTFTSRRPEPVGSQMPVQNGVPTLTLYNPSLDIQRAYGQSCTDTA